MNKCRNNIKEKAILLGLPKLDEIFFQSDKATTFYYCCTPPRWSHELPALGLFIMVRSRTFFSTIPLINVNNWSRTINHSYSRNSILTIWVNLCFIHCISWIDLNASNTVRDKIIHHTNKNNLCAANSCCSCSCWCGYLLVWMMVLWSSFAMHMGSTYEPFLDSRK